MTARTAPPATACLLCLAAAAAGGDEPAADRVTIMPRAPVVTVRGVPPGRYSVDLPTLEYTLELEATCGDGAVPQSLSVAVADTRARLSARELAAGGRQALVLTVPASQTAPLAVDDFCSVAPSPVEPAPGVPLAATGVTPAPSLLEVPDVLSAQVSLVCGEGEGQRMSWFSRPLPVTLACEPPAPQGRQDGHGGAAAPAAR